ncbi:MAG: homoserine dehydrogenase [Gammaproteobacteria bacterium]|nr:homoserine dehydrogenase [Gammaproteobacteria bacterium]
MQNQNVAIIGLNNVGTEFFRAMVGLKEKGVEVVSVSEKAFTEGTQLAQDLGVKNLPLEELVDQGEAIDIIFDLSGDREIRKELRKTLFSSNNQHTVIAPESVAQLMYTMIGDKPLPIGEHSNIGY